MASAWGDSWSNAWGSAWGSLSGFPLVDDAPVLSGGGWTESNDGGLDLQYWYAGPDGSGSNSARWTFTGLDAGTDYRLAITFPAHPNRSTATPYRIYDSDGTTVLKSGTLDQEAAPGDFAYLGVNWKWLRFATPTGTSLYVEIDDNVTGEGDDAYVIADAVYLDLASASVADWVTVQPGDYADPDTWDRSTKPPANVPVEIEHAVEVTTAEIVGPSPSNQTTLAIAVRSTTLTIKDGGSLTVRGNVALTNSTFQVGEASGGAVLEMDASLAGTPATKYGVYVGTGHNQTSLFMTRGSAGSRSIVRSNASGGNAFFGSSDGEGGAVANDRLGSCLLDLSRTDFLRIGSGNAADSAFHPNSGLDYAIDRCTFNACGDITWAGQVPLTTGVTITDSYWVNSVGSFNVKFLSPAGTPSGARDFSGSVWDKRFAGVTRNAIFDDSFFWDGLEYAQGGPKAASAQRCFIRWTQADPVGRYGDWQNPYMVLDGTTYDSSGAVVAPGTITNPHWTNPQTTDTGTYLVLDGIFEDFGSDSTGDVDYGANSTGYTTVFRRCLGITQVGDNPGTMATLNGWLGAACVYENCTWQVGQVGAIAVGEAGNGFAGMLASVQNCIFFRKVADGAVRGIGSYNAITSDIADAGNIGHNVFYNCGDDGDVAPGYDGQYSGGIPGANDIHDNPQFVDWGRNFSTWAEVLDPVWAAGKTRQEKNGRGLYKLSLVMAGQTDHPDYDSRYTLSAALTHTRGGYAPQNTALQASGYDGSDRGAVAVVAAPATGGGGDSYPVAGRRVARRSLPFPVRRQQERPTGAVWTDSGTLSAVLAATIGGRERFVSGPIPAARPERKPAPAPIILPPPSPQAWLDSGELVCAVRSTLDGRAYFIDRGRQLREDSAIIRAAVLGLDIGKALQKVT